MRPLPALAPEDSLHRALHLLRATGADALPVVSRRGELVGDLRLEALRPLLEAGDVDGTDPLDDAVAAWMVQPSAVAPADGAPAQARLAMGSARQAQLYVVDRAQRYLGAIALVDMLVPELPAPRPASVGGMATPWGVYLTTGLIQAGSGNWSLVASGALMGVLLVAAHVGVGLLTWAGQQAFGGSLHTLWNAAQPPATLAHASWYAVQAAALPLFLALVRATPLTAYHAAEHQVVHAVERGEPLRAEVVARMPRVHPRCGTNLMAAGVLFTVVSQVLPALRVGFGAADSAVLGAIAALFTWRRAGAWLQQHLTTRVANRHQLDAGIAAAEDLQRKYLSQPPRRPTIARRLWCAGVVQTGAGIAAGLFGAGWLSEAAMDLLRRG